MEPPSPYTISILNDSGRPVSEEGFVRVARIALADQRLPQGELSLRLTTSEEIRTLNRDFRRIDAATDVLTFPPADLPFLGAERPLGDIAISVDQAEVQSLSRHIPLEDELGHLLVHGVLHLAGFDDQSESDHAAMLKEMARVGILCGLAPAPDWQTLEEVAPRS